MAQNREIAGKPLVSLDAGRLLGMRQVAGVSTRVEDEATSAGSADAHVEVSRLLSKIGPPPEGSPATRAEMGRLLAKIGEPIETRPA